ncbi:MAG: hypothetical protein LC135_05660 [Phycisphaerae bacterium]|nr:hypothetical protein [Phycisphaerae bacterium]MCZ2399342.1 hypothetical protein [Phycisphaerae bacterium]NUQ48415.1 hypothetical protein [Phycisphaerae bacterium]
MTQAGRPAVVALVQDLVFGSKISATAALTRVHVTIVRSVEALGAEIAAVRGVIVDLEVVDDPDALMARMRGVNAALRVAGFYPHVRADLARRAREAGVHCVLTRSEFTQRLAEVLRELVAEPPRYDSTCASGV